MYDSGRHLPKLTVNIPKLKTNLREVISRCGDAGIEVAGVMYYLNVFISYQKFFCKSTVNSIKERLTIVSINLCCCSTILCIDGHVCTARVT